nr:hypothetical protein [Elizabethkingia bruuniana]
MLAPVRLNTICFTLKGEEKQDMVNQFLELLNATGKVFMTPTNYNQRKGIRAAFVNWRTTEHDVKLITEAMAELATDLK